MLAAARCPSLLSRARLLTLEALTLQVKARVMKEADHTVLGLVRWSFYSNKAFALKLDAERYEDLRDHIMRFADRTWQELKGLPVDPTPAPPMACQHPRTIDGYGYAAGQLGAYVMCEDCSAILSSEPERQRIDPHGRHPCSLELGLESCCWCHPEKPAERTEG